MKLSKLNFHPEYLKFIKTWDYLNDIYEGLSNWSKMTSKGLIPNEKTQAFLPKHEAESFSNWETRLNSTHYNGLFRKGIKKYLDLMFYTDDKLICDKNSPFFKFKDNITIDNYSYKTLVVELALDNLIYGRSYAVIDCLNKPCITTIKPQKVFNWCIENGELIEIWIQENEIYNNNIINLIYSYKIGVIDIFKKDESSIIKIKSIETDLDFIPICLIKSSRNNEIPFKDVADKTRSLYQKQSYHSKKISLCCNPVPVIKDPGRSVNDELIIGPNSFININDPSGSFKWEEPLALSLRESYREIEALKKEILDDISNFLITPSDRQTAYASAIQLQQVEGSINTFLIFFNESVSKLFTTFNKCFGDYSKVEYLLDPDIYKNDPNDL